MSEADPSVSKAQHTPGDVVEALKSASSWLERWAVHVGNCVGGCYCTCGLSFIRNEAEVAINGAHFRPSAAAKMQHVAYYDEGQFHWMSGIAPRDCELFAAIRHESAKATGAA